MPNLLIKFASLVITLIKGTGRSPILAIRKVRRDFKTAAVLINVSYPFKNSSLFVVQL